MQMRGAPVGSSICARFALGCQEGCVRIRVAAGVRLKRGQSGLVIGANRGTLKLDYSAGIRVLK